MVGALVMVMTGFGLGWINIAADWSRYQRRDAPGGAIVAWNTFGGALGPTLLVLYGLTIAGSDEEVLVTNRVPDSFGRLSDRPDTAYVVAAADGGTEIAKRVFAVSSDAGGDALPWIGATPLPPGETLEETLRVPLPLQAYAPPTVDAGEVPASGPVVFCVGVLVGRDPGWGFHDVDGVTTVNHGRAGAGQATFCSDPVEVG